MTVAKLRTVSQAISVTNFDFTALYLLRSEIKIILTNTELHLTAFYDDPAQTHLLLDSTAMLNQLAAVLHLISLSGANKLTDALASAMKQLYERANNQADRQKKRVIVSLSQGVMILQRYIEFVLLQQTVQPSLLLPMINQLRQLTNQPLLTNNDLVFTDYNQVTLANPARDFQSLAELDLNLPALTTAYRSGLTVVLSTSNHENLTTKQQQQLDAMYQACYLIAQNSTSLFWQAAQTATKDLAKQLPLTDTQKRIFIFIEQQFHSYLPADDSRFADLISYACLQHNKLAIQLKQQLQTNKLDKEQLTEFVHFMSGPDQAIATQLNELLQQEINDIKAQVYELVNDDNHYDSSSIESIATSQFELVSKKLLALCSIFRILQLPQVSNRLQYCAKQITQWQHPTDTDLDQLLINLMWAENAAVTLAKSYTPGGQAWRLNNPAISIYQLESAYQNLNKACRHLLLRLERSISDYLDPINPAHQQPSSNTDTTFIKDSYPDKILHQIPQTLRQVAGAIRFLDLSDAANILSHLALYLDNTFYQKGETLIKRDEHTYQQFAKVANILLAVDHQLSAREQQHPLSKQALQVGNSSLYQLISTTLVP